jgi:hypothetical protein
MTLFAALALPVQMTAQKHTRYKLVDIGTFDGPVSYFPFDGEGIQVLNNSGTVVGLADTSTPDPNAPDPCLNPDCFLTHAFRWQDGVLTDLGTLPGVNNNILVNNITINARRWIAGDSQNGVIDP